jgi:ADP-ribose pyrophosphatase YjhB (NUDIX family)
VIDHSWYVRPSQLRGERLCAGGVVVRSEAGEPLVALAREKGYPGPVLPKGGVERGEALELAARREVEEEVGLSRVTLVGKLGVVERLSYDKELWLTVHFFLFTTDQITGVPTDTAHHQHGPAWRRLDQLDDMFWPDQRTLIEAQAERIRQSVA